MRAPETMSPLLKGYQAKGNEKQQGEGVGHKFGKMGRRCLWMAPYMTFDVILHCILSQIFNKKIG